MGAFVRIVAAAATLLVSLSACSGVRGSGTAKTETRSVESFTKVDVSGAMKVSVARGAKNEVVITADDNLLEHLGSDVQSGTLVLDPKRSLRPETPIVVTVTMTEALEAFSASGSTVAALSGVRGDAFELDLSGSTDLSVSGTTRALTIDVSGSAQVAAIDLTSDTAKVEVSGSAEVSVHAKDALSVDISGSGKVRYRGSPTVERSVSGSGTIQKVE